MTWENVKIETLILSARHCCVCHRYAGLKIEVHHIKPRSIGGEDSLDNAIALCFDCHTDAGHYNPQHPRGSKFSPKELKLAKERWFGIVKSNKISIPAKISEHIHCRHVVLKSVSLAKEVCAGKIDSLPLEKTLMIKNNISDFSKKLLSKIGPYYACVLPYKMFPNLESVKNAYPELKKVNKSEPESPYFTYERIPSREELLSKREKLNVVIRYLLETNVPTYLFAKSVIFEAGDCGDLPQGDYEETFVFKDLWFAFLIIENRSHDSVLLSELSSLGREENQAALYSLFDQQNEDIIKTQFPKAPLNPGEKVLIPTAILACPFNYSYGDDMEIARKSLGDDGLPYSMLCHIVNSSSENKEYMFFGNYMRPTEIEYSIYGQKYSCDVHELDLNNLYTIDEYWDCGSCPHLFVQKTDERWYYVKELFVKSSEVDQLETIKVNSNTLKIRIAELENETTIIRFIKQNGKYLYNDIEMVRGNVIEIEVKEGDLIELFGHYRKFFENIPETEQHIFRNRLIGEYLSKVNGITVVPLFVCER